MTRPPSPLRRRTWILVWIAGGLAVAAYLAANLIYAVRHPTAIHVDVPRWEGRYILRTAEVVSFSAVRHGRLLVGSETRLEDMAVTRLDPATGAARPGGPRVHRLPRGRFALTVEDDLLDWTIEFHPRDPAPDPLHVRAILRPEVRWSALPFQWAAGVLILMFIVFSAAAVWGMVRPGLSGEAAHARRAMLAFLGLCTVFLLYAVGHPAGYLRVLGALRGGAAGVAALNLAGAGALVGLAVLFSKTRLPEAGLPVLFSLVFVAAGWTYRLPVCGDADQWIHYLMESPQNPAAELLSFALARALLSGLRSIEPAASPLIVLSVLGKAAGVLYFFGLHRLAARLPGASRDRRVVFFLAAAALPVTVFFFGYPEFAYLPLPFLLLAVLAAERYLRTEDGLPALAGAAAALGVAALVHGGPLVCVPALLLLPFIKSARSVSGRPRPLVRCARDSLLALAVVAALVAGVLLAHRLAGISLLWANTRGGGDRDRFVELFQTARATGAGAVFLELRYLWLGGWTVLTGVPVALLAMAGRLKAWAARDGLDLTLFLFGAPSVLLYLFWNHDLGFRDLDLLIAPLTLLQLLAIKAVLEAGGQGRASRDRLLLAALAASGGFFLILAFTTGA